MKSLLLVFVLMISGWLTTNHFGPWVSWHSELPFFAIGILMSFGLMRARRNQTRFVLLPMALWPIVLISGVAIAQWLYGIIIWRGQLAVILLYLALAAISIWWGVYEGAAVRPRSLKPTKLDYPGEWLAWGIIICGLITWFLMAAQVFELWEDQSWIGRMPYIRRPGGNVGQSNHAATLMVMAVGAIIYLYSAKRFERIVAISAVLLFLSGVAIAESRGGLLAVLMLSIWCGCCYVVKDKRTRYWCVALLAIASILMFLLWPLVFSIWQMSNVHDGGLERIRQSAGDSRWVIWHQLVGATFIHPWVGWGVRNTAVAMNTLAGAEGISYPLTYSHNIILDLAIWIGWPLTLAIVLLAAWWAFRRLAVRKSNLGFLGGSLLIPFLIHSLLEFPFAYAYLLLPAMVAVGYIEAVFYREVRCKKCNLPLPEWAGLYLLLIGSFVAAEYISIEQDFRDMRFQLLKIGPTLIEKQKDYYILNQLDDMVRSMKLEIKTDMTVDEIELLRNAAASNPWSAIQYRYAMALALNGFYREASRQLDILAAQHGRKAELVFRKQINEALMLRKIEPLPALELQNE